MMTKRYLKDNDLLAIPFDKGVGICVMKKQTYHSKLDQIISLPQFEKVFPARKNAKHPVFKEEENIISALKVMKANGEQISVNYNCINKLSQGIVNLIEFIAWLKFTKMMSRYALFCQCQDPPTTKLPLK